MNPRVSVIIPTYDRATKVPKGIASVLDQTYSDLEVIVVDDGSSDGTGKILGEMFGDRIRYFAPVSYTHLDVYKRQHFFMLVTLFGHFE